MLECELMKNNSSIMQRIFSAVTGNKSISEENKVTAQKSLDQIFTAIDRLAQKAEGIEEKFPETTTRIKNIQTTIHTFILDVSTFAGKTEQAISQKITCVSSSCDALLSGGEKKDLDTQLADLEKLIQQRLRPAPTESN